MVKLDIVVELGNEIIYIRTLEQVIWKEFPVLANLVEDMNENNNSNDDNKLTIPIVLPNYTTIQDFDCLMNKEKWTMLTIGAIFIGSYLGHEYNHSIIINGKKHDCIDRKIILYGINDNKILTQNIIISQESLAKNTSYGHCKYNLTLEFSDDKTSILDQTDFSDHYTSTDQDWIKLEYKEYYSDNDNNKNHWHQYKKIIESKFSLSNSIDPYQLTVQEFNLLISVKSHADRSNLLTILGKLILYIQNINPATFHKHMKYPDVYPLYMILKKRKIRF
jgi:hypothetical protein